jgi:nucleoside-diphosphate-sugar epimerase
MNVLVIGGTLFIGRPLVAGLLKAGHQVTVLHRKSGHNLGRRVGEIVADRNDPAAIREALADRPFDVVFDNVYDWERGTTAAHIEATARACCGKLRRYIFMSSVAAYGDGLNHHEGDALAPDDHPEVYARNKATSERVLFRLHQRIGFPAVTIRPPFVYGPCNPFYREAFFWDRLRDKRPILVPGDGRRLMQFVYVKDLVWACLRAMEEPAAIGHAFNVANLRPVTQTEMVDALAAVAAKKAQTVRMPRERIMRTATQAVGQRLYFGQHFDLPPITQVVSKAQRVLGFHPTDFHEGLKATYRWYQRHHNHKPQDYTFEDKLLGTVTAVAAS